MNKYISKILIVLAVITLSLTFTGSARAEYPTLKDCVDATWTTPVGCDKVMARYYAGYYSNGYDYGYTTTQYAYTQPVQPTQYAYAQPIQSGAPVVNNYYYKTNPTTTKTTTSTTVKSATTGSSSSDTAVKSNTSSTQEEADESQTFNNNLPALAFAGSGGFLPSSFWQWLLVAVLILAIVILVRLINRSTHKEVHGAPAH